MVLFKFNQGILSSYCYHYVFIYIHQLANKVEVAISSFSPRTNSIRSGLTMRCFQNCLEFTSGSVVSLETSAQTSIVAAKSTAGAITPLGTSISIKNVRSRGTFLLRAVGATESIIALAAHCLVRIPRGVVSNSLQYRECLLSQANTTSRAVVGTHCTLARLSIVIFKARAFTGIAIAHALVGTFHSRMNIVFGHCQFG